MSRLGGQVALVTGGSRGIGKAIALELAKAGANVAIAYQSNEELAQAVADEITSMGVRAMAVQADVGESPEARAMVHKVVEEFGRLDILVNNAGITRDGSLKKMTDQQWEKVIGTNLNSCFYCTSAALPAMTEQKSGRIINVSSMNGQIGAFGQANYSASKGGMIAFTRTAALELARSNITVNTVAPGFTETDMFAAVPEQIQDQLKGKIPMGRFAKPEEISAAVVFLAAEGSYITGQQINVNGGAYM